MSLYLIPTKFTWCSKRLTPAVSCFLSSLSNTNQPQPYHLLVVHAPCLVMTAPVIPGRFDSTITQVLANVPSSGLEAARAMPITLCQWSHAGESVRVWSGSLHLHLAEWHQGEGHLGVCWGQGHSHTQLIPSNHVIPEKSSKWS